MVNNNSPIDLHALAGRVTELEQIIALMPGFVYWKDRQHIYRGCNTGITKLINLPNCQAIAGKAIYDFFEKSLADEVTATDEAVMSQGVEYSIEEEAVDAEGDYAVYLTHKVPLKNIQGEVVGMLGMSFDITDRKRQEAIIKQAKEDAEAASIAKSDFLLNMGHDLRTPFSGLIGITEQLALIETNEEKKTLLGYILQSARRLLDLLNQILESAAIAKKGIKNNFAPLHLPTLLTAVGELVKVQAKNKGIELTITINPAVPEQLIGDEVKMHRILLNLLGNAIKFTNQGGVKLHVGVSYQTEQKIWLVFNVHDTGIGIPADKLTAIFERFSLVNPSYSGTYNGLGLGLHIVRQFVNELNGEVSVTSEFGKGSTFTCVMPFDRTIESQDRSL